MFDQNLIQNVLSLSMFAISLFISVRAFYLYFRSRNRRLFILAISMGIIALTAIAGFAGDNVTTISLNVDWFNYIGQTVSFLFILLSFTSRSDDSTRSLIRWQIVISVLLLFLLVLAPVLPAQFPDPAVTKTILGGSRGLICLFVCLYYAAAFTAKETRFSILMGAAFLLLSAGYFIVTIKYGTTGNTDLYDHVGDISRLFGLITLGLAVLLG